MSIRFTIPNAATKVDWTATSVSGGGSTIPIINKPVLSGVATSGKYTDLTLQPTIPSKVSQLTNDTAVMVNPVSYEPMFGTGAYAGPATIPNTNAPPGNNYAPIGQGIQFALPSGATVDLFNANNSGYGWYNDGTANVLIVRNTYRMTVTMTNTLQWRGFLYHIAKGGKVNMTLQLYSGFGTTPFTGAQAADYNSRNIYVNNTVVGQYDFNVTTLTNPFLTFDVTAALTQDQTRLVMTSFMLNTSNGGNIWRDIRFTLTGGATLYASDLNVAGNLTAGGVVTLPAPLAAVWYNLSNSPIAAGSTATFTGPWTLQNFSKIPTGITLLQPDLTLRFPYTGIYNISLALRFGVVTGENAVWFRSVTGTYGTQQRLAVNGTAKEGVLLTSTYTGYFAAGDAVAPTVYASVANNSSTAGGECVLTMTMLQRAS